MTHETALRVTSERLPGDVVVLVIVGEHPTGMERLEVEGECVGVVIDVSPIEWLNSEHLAPVFALFGRLQERCRPLVLCGANARATELLYRVKADTVFPIVGTREEALDALVAPTLVIGG